MRRFTTKDFPQKGGVIKNQKNFRKNVQIIILVVAFWLSLFDEHKHSVLLDLVINIVYIGHELCQGKTHAVVYTSLGTSSQPQDTIHKNMSHCNHFSS